MRHLCFELYQELMPKVTHGDALSNEVATRRTILERIEGLGVIAPYMGKCVTVRHCVTLETVP